MTLAIELNKNQATAVMNSAAIISRATAISGIAKTMTATRPVALRTQGGLPVANRVA